MLFMLTRIFKVVEAPSPLKVVETRDDISVAMKLEVYPNRDSLV